MNNSELEKWGLSERFAQEATMHLPLELGRVTEQHHNLYKVITSEGFVEAVVSGKFAFHAMGSADYPAVGDWVMLEIEPGSAIIHHILSRKSVFLRKAAGSAQGAQIVAANIDTVFICMAVNEDYNLRRLERYLAVAWDSGAVPVIVLTKADLCADLADKVREAEDVALGAEVIACSSLDEDGYAAVLPQVRPGKTIAFIGSSGVGKSTLINRLAGEELLLTREIRDDGKGRHTTTHRQMLALPGGAVVIDTPGMRELGVISADAGKPFADIEALAEQCRFHDCSHTAEPGCAVQAAIAAGELDAARLDSYRKIQTEAGYQGLTSRQIEEEKVNRMFGGKNEMKQMMREIKSRDKRR